MAKYAEMEATVIASLSVETGEKAKKEKNGIESNKPKSAPEPKAE